MSRRLIVSLVVAALLVAACGSASGRSGGVAEGQDVVVDMYDDVFEYTEIRIPMGGTVNWVGAGRNPHNAVASDGSWTTETVFGSLKQLEGDEARLTYDTPGEYPFFCTFHGNAEGKGMAGVLIVGDGS